MRHLALGVALLGLAGGAPSFYGQSQELREVHQSRAHDWLARNGFEPAEPPALEDVLARGFAHLPLGVYDVMVLPRSLADWDKHGDLEQALLALLDIQLEWLDLLPSGGELPSLPKGLASDGRTLRKWIEKWKWKALADPAATRGANLLELLDANEKVREAAADLSGALLAGLPLRELEEPLPPAGLILVPHREDFVELLAVAGLLAERHRPFFWRAGVIAWAFFDFDGNRVVALEYANAVTEEDYTDAFPMNRKNDEELAQQVAHLGLRSLFEATIGPTLPVELQQGLANEVVIEQYGEVFTRADGDQRGRSVGAVDVFVHGGNPSGGTVATSAESPWRERHGADRFHANLLRAQKDGSEEAPSKDVRLACFQILDDARVERHVVRAPFLGAGASAPPPEAFQGDGLELLRAYRTAFWNWLRTEAGRNKKDSAARFGALLRALALGSPLEPAVVGAYGVPISAPSTTALMERDADSLEKRFLIWLSKL